MAKKQSSVEEQVEDWAKLQLSKMGLRYYTKTEPINEEIEAALKKAPSKQGGSGANIPDIKLFIETDALRRIPVMVEAKGKLGKLAKLTAAGAVDNVKKSGEPNYTNINGYAVNGAVHYANAILNFTETYEECLAIGINGYRENNELCKEVSVWYVDRGNYGMPKLVGEYSDLSLLDPQYRDKLIEMLDNIELTPEEIEIQKRELENSFSLGLKRYNQYLYEELNIEPQHRVYLTVGLIMAGLGIPGLVAPLELSELRGQIGKRIQDGDQILNKIESFLDAKGLSENDCELILDKLRYSFRHPAFNTPDNGETVLRKVYSKMLEDIMDDIRSDHRIDFMGQLFNILNDWVDVPDGDRNDVVLTPRYVTDFMARLGKVNMNSYVWDTASGSGGFLVSALNLMLKDANERLSSQQELHDKIEHIKKYQLMGVEIRRDIFMLNVLNALLMDGGYMNIICGNSLTEFDGNYRNGDKAGEKFKATVFLLNPPYSAPGKGFNFVEKALSEMPPGGRAVVLIQENAGSSNGLPYTERILKDNTLVASIHMADIFCGKASVRTAIYVFDVGTPHDPKKMVKFIDMDNDGYARQNRKKSGQEVNLKDVDHAKERYDEVVDLVLYGKSYLHYYTEDEYFEDTITLKGDDWTVAQHRVIDTTPTEGDFANTVKEYLAWKVGAVLRGEISVDGE